MFGTLLAVAAISCPLHQHLKNAQKRPKSLISEPASQFGLKLANGPMQEVALSIRYYLRMGVTLRQVTRDTMRLPVD